MHRLKTRPQFQAAMAGGTIARTPHFALHRLVLTANDTSGSTTATPSGPGAQPPRAAPQALFAFPGIWMGAMVPKRWARRAVTRNAIKRQIYAVADVHQDQIQQAVGHGTGAHVVRLRSTFDRKQFISPSSDVLKQAVRAELLQLFAYARKADARATAALQAANGTAAAALPEHRV